MGKLTDFTPLSSLITVFVSICVILLIMEVPLSGAKLCTKTKFEVRRNTSIVKVTCIQKFLDRCNFLFDYCTYYRVALCEKPLNFTYKWYFAEHVCCPGYVMGANNVCTEMTSVGESQFGPDWDRLSSGAYAGIAAAGVLLLCLIGILIIVILRRNQKLLKETNIELEQRASLKTDPDPKEAVET